MKTIIRLSLLMIVVLGVSGCSTIAKRIEEKSAVFYSLDPATRAKVARGDVDLGYTPDLVYIALGSPDRKRQRLASQGSTETWIYETYYADDYPLWGWGGGYYGRPFGRRGWYGYDGFYGGGWGRPHRMYPARHEDTRITFKDGRVVTVDQPKK